MDKTTIYQELQTRMESALKVLDHEFKGLRTGRASVNLLDSIRVEMHGEKMPLIQLASLATPDPRTISVQVWDKAMVKLVEKAITEANLGVTPVSDGQLVRITIPSLTEERRKELAKLAHKYGENIKIALRNIRRDGNDNLEKWKKSSEITKDEHHNLAKEIQKVTDEFCAKVDSKVKQKEQDIMVI